MPFIIPAITSGGSIITLLAVEGGTKRKQRSVRAEHPAAPLMEGVFTFARHVFLGADKGHIFSQPNVGGQYVFPEHLDHVLSEGRTAGGPGAGASDG